MQEFIKSILKLVRMVTDTYPSVVSFDFNVHMSITEAMHTAYGNCVCALCVVNGKSRYGKI